MIEIRPCTTDADFASAIRLTRDYIAWLDMDLSFQGIDGELSAFAAMYGPPDGRFLMAWHADKPAAGVGLRMLEPGICEMKRLFVYERHRGKGVGRDLCAALVEEAKKLGYEKMRLDTLERMAAAKRLYEILGFEEIAPYRFNPHPTATYMELRLA